MYKKSREHLAEMQLKDQIGVDAFSIFCYAHHEPAYSRQSLSLGHGYLWSISSKWLSSFLHLSVICKLLFFHSRDLSKLMREYEQISTLASVAKRYILSSAGGAKVSPQPRSLGISSLLRRFPQVGTAEDYNLKFART